MANKGKKKDPSGKALVYVVLDKSGSMWPIHQATVDGVNDFIKETAKADPTAEFHLSMFDTNVVKTHSGVPIASAERLDGLYHPGGNTALLDAIGRAVKEIEDLPTAPDKVVVVIMTDGQENSSHEYTRAAVQAMISKHESKDKWQFLFLGANLDAFAEAGAIGMRNAATSSARWQQTPVGTQAAYLSASVGTADYLRGRTFSVNLTQDSYNQTLASLQGSGTAPDTSITVDSSTATGTTAAKPRSRAAK